MSNSIALAQRAGTWNVPRITFDPKFFLELFTTCFLLALMYQWASWVAPQVGLYLTANLGLFAYSYFALARAIYLRHQSCDASGNYVPSRRAKAIQDFNRLVRARVRPLIRATAPIAGLAAVAGDVLMHSMQWQMRAVLQVPLLGLAVLIWVWCAPRFIIACSGWTPVVDYDQAAADALIAGRSRFTRLSFLAMAGLMLLVGIGSMQLVNGPILVLVASYIPHALVWHAAAVATFTAVAWFCLNGQATWSQWVRGVLVDTNRKCSTSPSHHA